MKGKGRCWLSLYLLWESKACADIRLPYLLKEEEGGEGDRRQRFLFFTVSFSSVRAEV